MKIEKVYFKNSKGEKLSGLVYVPDGKGAFPAVALLHGMPGGIHETKNQYMCNALMKSGFVALQFDFYNRPNNLSEPKIENMTMTQQIETTRFAIDFIASLPYVNKNKIGLTGHSLGGTTAILYAASKDPRIKALVIQSAVSQLKNLEKAGINQSALEDAKKYDVYKEAEKITCPTLVFHGNNDKTVDFRQSEELIEHIKAERKKLEIIEGTGHVYSDKGALQTATTLMIAWFDEWLK